MGINLFIKGSLILNDDLRKVWNENVSGVCSSLVISLNRDEITSMMTYIWTFGYPFRVVALSLDTQ